MKKIQITGGKKLHGTIRISGAKNAALPILAATILPKDGISQISNLPMVKDVSVLCEILRKLGADVKIKNDTAIIDTNNINEFVLPVEESKLMRASVLLAGPMLSKFGHVVITEPGGCVIGKRPIDFHLKGFEALGAKITEVNNQYVKIEAKKLIGTTIELPFPSVTATENLMMAACYAEGFTIIENSAKEPEIQDLANYLITLGAKISGAGTSKILIEGVKNLSSSQYTIIPDRIETGTYIIATAITGGEVILSNTRLDLLDTVVNKLRGMGIGIEENTEGVLISSPRTIKPMDIITEVYPGFPTDLQSIILPLLSIAEGESSIKETIFDKRFSTIPELRKMNANLEIIEDTIYVKGVKNLKGSVVEAKNLRSGGSLIVAGLAAEGTTIIESVEHILRGYETPVLKLAKAGANISFLD